MTEKSDGRSSDTRFASRTGRSRLWFAKMSILRYKGSVVTFISNDKESERRHDFTTQPEMAKSFTLSDGREVLVASALSRFAAQQIVPRRKKIWDALLDKMEELLELEEAEPTSDVRRALALGREHEEALVRSLCFLVYGTDDSSARSLIRAQANARYSQESGE